MAAGKALSRCLVGGLFRQVCPCQTASTQAASCSLASRRSAHFETAAYRRDHQQRHGQRPGGEGRSKGSRKGQPWGGQQDPRVRELLAEVKAAARAKDCNEVLQILREVPESPPGASWAPVYFSALAACCREGRYLEALSVWEDMPVKDEVAYNTMISFCGRIKRLQEARQLFSEMHAKSVRPSGMTYCALLNGLSGQAKVEDAGALLEEMKGHPWLDQNTDWDQVYLLVITAAARAGQLERARAYMREARDDRNILPRQHHYNALMVACARVADSLTASQLFQEMQQQGLVPREMDWNIYLQCCRQSFADCRAVFTSMLEAGVVPTEETFAALLQAAGLSRQREDAEWVLSEMQGRGISPYNPASPRLRLQLQRMGFIRGR